MKIDLKIEEIETLDKVLKEMMILQEAHTGLPGWARDLSRTKKLSEKFSEIIENQKPSVK